RDAVAAREVKKELTCELLQLGNAGVYVGGVVHLDLSFRVVRFVIDRFVMHISLVHTYSSARCCSRASAERQRRASDDRRAAATPGLSPEPCRRTPRSTLAIAGEQPAEPCSEPRDKHRR